MGNIDGRIQRRYQIDQIDEKNQQNYYVDIIGEKAQTRVLIADISSTGIGFEIELGEFTGMDMKENTEVQIKMFYPGGTISGRAKIMWDFIIEDDESEILKGGLMFTILSPEENKKLSNLIADFAKKII